ncbi:cinnamyl alcohol dehydrogenase 8 [Mayamaea pseudoterrestris]|nr:cinnamyl alcohol dehydrogenase 8 [Mayamaea pseudoterrestris]
MATIKDGTGTIMLAAFDTSCDLKKLEAGRPKVGSNDISIDIQFCGMCHSDLHACNGDWGSKKFPIAPGHEIAGIVKDVGDKVKEFKVGDRVGVGCLVDSCRSCDLCQKGLENHCPGAVQTYCSDFPDGKGANMEKAVGYYTNGGYSTDITVSEHFVFHIPKDMDMEYAGILLCAGITMFSPLNRHILERGGGEGKHIGIVGFGGLGQMGVKLAKAMGCEVTILSRNRKKESAAKALGANLLVHADEKAIKSAERSFDLILDTVSAKHPIGPLASILKVGGTMILIGGVSQPFEISALQLAFGRQAIRICNRRRSRNAADARLLCQTQNCTGIQGHSRKRRFSSLSGDVSWRS